MAVKDEWTYHRGKKFDRNRMRWHFVTHYCYVDEGTDEPRELYFRNDEETEFGMIRFDRIKDFPYRDWDFLMNTIMSHVPFRRALLEEGTRGIWKKNWK